MLTGIDIDANELKFGNDYGSYKSATKVMLKDCVGIAKKQTCFDQRFEKDPVILAIEQIEKHGLNEKLLQSILKSKTLIKRGKLFGKFLILQDFIPKSQFIHINERLNYYNSLLHEKQKVV